MSLAQKSGLGFMCEFSTIGTIKREEPLVQTLYLQNLKIIYRESLARETYELLGLAEENHRTKRRESCKRES